MNQIMRKGSHFTRLRFRLQTVTDKKRGSEGKVLSVAKRSKEPTIGSGSGCSKCEKLLFNGDVAYFVEYLDIWV